MKPKVEVKRETRVNGDVFFCIYVDDRYYSSYLAFADAKSDFEAFTKGTLETIEIVLTTEKTADK